MKKRICLLITLIISLFVFSGRVEAAEKRYCIYESRGLTVSTMLVQDSSGGISMFYHEKSGTFAPDDEGWYEYSNYDIVFESKYYDDETKTLTGCPNYHSTRGWENEAVFHDEKLTLQENYVLIDFGSGDDADVGGDQFTFKLPSFYEEQINNTEWLGKCVYGLNDVSKLEIYFNDEIYIILNYMSNSTTAHFAKDELLKIVNDARACPPYMYLLSTSTKITSTQTFRTDSVYLYSNERIWIPGNAYGTTITKSDLPVLEEDIDIDFGELEPPTEPIENCSDLFGEELLEQVNKVMDIIKIAVPILLIGFGIIDFTKAIFAGNEDDMSKSKKVFFKRVVAAILVFIAPIFINLILSLANEVWEYISPDACISQTK